MLWLLAPPTVNDAMVSDAQSSFGVELVFFA